MRSSKRTKDFTPYSKKQATEEICNTYNQKNTYFQNTQNSKSHKDKNMHACAQTQTEDMTRQQTFHKHTEKLNFMTEVL